MYENLNKEEKLLRQQLKEGDSAATRKLYKELFPLVVNIVTKNKGTLEDAKDIMQLAMIALLKNIQEDKFKTESTVKSYFMGIVKNTWLNQLKKRKKQVTHAVSVDEADEYLLEEENIIISSLLNLDLKCRELLQLFYYEKKSLKVIAEALDYTESFVRVKKTRCMKSLKKIVLENALMNRKYNQE